MEIFTDGSHSLKPRMSGVGAVIISNGREYEIGSSTNKCENNNVAEVMAMARIFQENGIIPIIFGPTTAARSYWYNEYRITY